MLSGCCMVASYGLVKKLLPMTSSLRFPLGEREGGGLALKCFCRPASAALLLLTMSSPSRQAEGRHPEGSSAAVGGAFRVQFFEVWPRAVSGRGKRMCERSAGNRVTGECALGLARVLLFLCVKPDQASLIGRFFQSHPSSVYRQLMSGSR